MFIVRLIRFLQGYVRFHAQGVFVERFLNLLARERISVWDGRKRGDTYTGCVRASSYRKMRKHAKKTGVKLSLADKEGMPFKRRKYRKRTGLLIGVALFAGFLWIMSGFIWRIEVNGNEELEDWQIISALEDLGIGAGTWRSSINVREGERLMMLRLEDLSWIALNIEGSVMRVEVNERTPPPKMLDPSVPCNIVATHTGHIVRMHVYEGQALLQVGDTVMAGDIIVSGITEDRGFQNLFRHSYADVYAEVQLSLEAEVPLEQMEYRETGKVLGKKYFCFSIFNLPLHLPQQPTAPYRVDRVEEPVTLFGIPLPFSLLKEEYILMEQVPIILSEAEAEEQALAGIRNQEKIALEGADILDTVSQRTLENGVYTLRNDYTCIMQIGAEKEILLSPAQSGSGEQ